MAKPKKAVPSLIWTDVKDGEGAVLGRYAIERGMIIVRSAKGWEKKTQVGNLDAAGGLARLILSEPPPR